MVTLSVKDFSCLEEAEIKISPLTILIGPQASGKSVLSKLIYFCINQIHHQYFFAEDGLSIENFVDKVEAEFSKWFPPAAWGAHKFLITFAAGPISISISRRRKTKSGLSEKVNVKFSPYLIDLYNGISESYKAAQDRVSSSPENLSSPRTWEITYKIRSQWDRKMATDLGRDFVSYQLFIPAGRSFFTSVGKAISVFDHGGLLDPVTLRFGRLFGSYRERARARVRIDNSGARIRHERLMREMFGGDIKFDRDSEYVETVDGRKIPFSALSSGQQELLPLWSTIADFADIRTSRQESGTWMAYIEEPEAHLFPSAQSLLIEFLASLISSSKHNRNMVITTHSPYVLSKINNLLLAGQLLSLRERPVPARRGLVPPRSSWLPENSVAAYAIINRCVVSINSEEGLIDGEYLDSVSSKISEEFLELLNMQIEGGDERLSGDDGGAVDQGRRKGNESRPDK